MITRAILSFTALTPLLLAQTPAWVRKDIRGIAFGPVGVASDTARGRLVFVFDGTWEWDGVAWTRRASANAPSDRAGHALAYDPVRKVTVLFGGGFPATNETWEWDGVDWHARTPAASPPASWLHGMVFDPVRQRTLLFTDAAQTWEWDGTNWTQRTPANSPPARMQFHLVWDAVRQRAVLVGGLDANFTTAFGDTWEWNGSNWTQGPAGIPARGGHAMAFDPLRRRVVVHGGMSASFNVLDDVWEYDGVQWVQETNTVHPSFLTGHFMSWDSARQELVLFGGQTDTLGLRNDLWTRRCQNNCAGTVWQHRSGPLMPMVDRGPALAFDSLRSRIVMFGGYDNGNDTNDTWEFDRGAWSLLQPATRPPARSWQAISFDGARCIVFGGMDMTVGSLADTWLFDGLNWQQPTLATAPQARSSHAMVRDTARNEVVLFGGMDNGPPFGDTWVWNGSGWAQRQPATSPPGRAVHAMANDTVRSRVVLFGGFDANGTLADTWEWNGITWTQRTPATAPAARVAHAMAFDPARGRVILHGGEDGSFNYFSDGWEWDGTTWTQLTGVQPQGRADHAMVTGNGEILLFSGIGNEILDPVWSYTVQRPAAATAYGSGCGQGALAAYGRPALGQRRFGIDLVRAPANAGGVIALAVHQASQPMLGCTLLLGSPVPAELALTNQSGFASQHMGVPFNPALRGIDVFAQGFALEFANMRVHFTSGLRLQVGD